MSLNDFARQVTVAFEEEIFPEFEDRLILSSKVTVNQEDGKQMERSGDVVWRPMPMIATSNDGMDASNNFKEITDLVVPATLGFQKHVARAMDAKELRDDLRKKRFGKAAAVRLASDINIAGMDTLCNQATLIDTKTSAAAGYADPARLDSLCNRNGIPQAGRQLAYCSPDYNGMADNLAGRGTLSGKPLAAYEKGLIGEDVAGFMAHKLDYANICNAAAGSGITMDTRASATNYWVPKAKRVSATGELANVDNRYQQITVSSTTNVLAGDWFTIAGVYEAHKINEAHHGQPEAVPRDLQGHLNLADDLPADHLGAGRIAGRARLPELHRGDRGEQLGAGVAEHRGEAYQPVLDRGRGRAPAGPLRSAGRRWRGDGARDDQAGRRPRDGRELQPPHVQVRVPLGRLLRMVRAPAGDGRGPALQPDVIRPARW
jgi:hypothetical protein